MRLTETLRRVREHHAVEHATVTILAQCAPASRIMGRSDWVGFEIIGKVPATLVRDAASQALHRLKAGEARLAVHPRCGTNLAVGIMLVSLFSLLVPAPGRKGRAARLVRGVLFLGVTLLSTKPLGMLAQQWVTTTQDLSRVQGVDGVRSQRVAGVLVHRVTLAR